MSRSFVLSVTLAACFALSMPATGYADGFSFSVGGGHGHHHHGHHHHHRHHHHGHSWGFSYWVPPPTRYVYVPPPIVQERIYVQPPVVQQPVIIQQAATYSAPPANATSTSLPSPPTRTAASGQPVVIRNSSGKGVPVAFLVDDRSEELRDGQARSFSGSSHVIEFDRGGDLGTARYELTSGVYAFSVTDRGWELVRETTSPARTADRPALRKNELPDDPISR